MKLRSLIVVTGTVHVEGGDKTTFEEATPAGRGRTTRVQTKFISADRKRANVITTGFMRDLRSIRVLKTPFGTLVAPERHAALDDLLADIDRTVAVFNQSSPTTKLLNAVLHEPLKGPRLASVEGWIGKRLVEGNKDVAAATPQLFSGS